MESKEVCRTATMPICRKKGTPAMAAKLTGHVWSFRGAIRYRDAREGCGVGAGPAGEL